MRTPPAGTWAQIRERLYKYRFVLLLIFLVAFMAVTSLFQLLHFPDWPLTLAFAFIVVAAINAASDKKILTWLATAIAIPTLVLSAFRTTLGGSTIEIATDLVAIALLVLMIVIVLRHIFSRTVSNFNILSGVAVLYLLLAIAWAMVFRVTEEHVFEHHGFRCPTAKGDQSWASIYGVPRD